MASTASPHPEVPRAARPRRTHDRRIQHRWLASRRRILTILDRALAAAAFAACGLVASGALAQSPGNFSTLSTTGTATFGGAVLACSGQPWIDVRCNGAVGDDTHDDTSAIQTTIATAITNNWPVHIPSG